jgi:hypothetical protein
MPHREAELAALVKHVDAKPAQGRSMYEKSLPSRVPAGTRVFRQHELDNFLDLLLRRRIDLDGKQFTRDADGGVVSDFTWMSEAPMLTANLRRL